MLKSALREIESLWTLFTAPVVWGVHFIICYLTFAVHCAKYEGSAVPGVPHLIVAATTLLALAAIALSAWLSFRQWGFGTDDPPHDGPTRHDRKLFQGFATLLLSGLSFLAVVYCAIPVLFIAGCQS